MTPPPSAVVTTPRRSRAELVLVSVFAAILLAPLAGLVALPWIPFAPAIATLVGFAVAVGNIVRQWGDRVELHPDRLVDRRGRKERSVALDDVEDVKVSLFDPRQGFGAHQTVTVTVRPKQGAPVVVRGSAVTVEPWLTALASSLATRIRGRLARGETVTFPDRGRFPLVTVGLVSLLVLGLLIGAVALARGDNVVADGVKLIRFFMLLSFVGWGAIRSAQQWFASRKSRGLAVSSRGIVPLTEARPDVERVVGYRDAFGAAGPWIPWGEVVSSALDGYGLTVQTNHRAAPIALTAHTENLFVLDRLLTECVQRERGGALWDEGTGVRVGEAPTPEERDDLSDDADRARRARR